MDSVGVYIAILLGCALIALLLRTWRSRNGGDLPLPRSTPRPDATVSSTPRTEMFRWRSQKVDAAPSRRHSGAIDENVQFTVYRPREIAPPSAAWYTLLAFVHLSERRPDEPNSPDPIAEVERQAERVLSAPAAQYHSVVSDAARGIPRSGELTLIPRVDGLEFNPPQYSFRWEQSVHRAEFQFRPVPGITAGTTLRGHLVAYLGSIIVGDVALTIPVAAVAVPDQTPVEKTNGRAYRNIFASYSHDDVAIVEEFERFVERLGDRYIRDVRDLRAGEKWSEKIETLIESADVFQLFWSWNALQSSFMRKEWEFALDLKREGFVRPVYWEDPLPSRAGMPPESLLRLHFERVPQIADIDRQRGEPASRPHIPPIHTSRWRVPRAAAALVVLCFLSISSYIIFRTQGGDSPPPPLVADPTGTTAQPGPSNPPPGPNPADPSPNPADPSPKPSPADPSPRPGQADPSSRPTGTSKPTLRGRASSSPRPRPVGVPRPSPTLPSPPPRPVDSARPSPAPAQPPAPALPPEVSGFLASGKTRQFALRLSSDTTYEVRSRCSSGCTIGLIVIQPDGSQPSFRVDENPVFRFRTGRFESSLYTLQIVMTSCQVLSECRFAATVRPVER